MGAFSGTSSAYLGGLFDPLGELADQDEEARKVAAPPPSDEGGNTRTFPGPGEAQAMRARAARPSPAPIFRGPPAPPMQAPSRVVASIPDPADSTESLGDAVSTFPTAGTRETPPADPPVPPLPDDPSNEAPPVDGGGADEPPADAPAPAPTPAPPPKNRDLTYETWLRSHPQAPPQNNLSWLSRGAEDIRSSLMGEKANYSVANEMDARTNAANSAGPKSYAQWLQAQKIGSEVGKNDREGQPKPPGDALAVAGVNAKSREKVANINNRMKGIVEEMKVAQGDRKLALQRELGLLNNELKGQMETGRNDRATEGNTSHERVAGQNLAAADKRFEAGQNFREDQEARKSIPGELSDAMTALQDFKKAGPQALADVGWWDRLLRAAPFGAGEPYVKPEKLSTMSKEDAFRAFQTRMETGLAMTDSERADARKRFGLNVFSNPTLFHDMIDYYEGLGNARAAQKQGGLSGRALGKFGAGGGYVAPAAARGAGMVTPPALPPVEPGHVRITGTDGTLDVLESDVAEALAETKPDGTPKYKRVP